MPHCTSSYPFYLGKFLLGLGGMMYLYCKYLQEKQFQCLCPMRDREIRRNQGNVKLCTECATTVATVQQECGRKNATAATAGAWCPCQQHCKAKATSTTKDYAAAPVEPSYCEWHGIFWRKILSYLNDIKYALKQPLKIWQSDDQRKDASRVPSKRRNSSYLARPRRYAPASRRLRGKRRSRARNLVSSSTSPAYETSTTPSSRAVTHEDIGLPSIEEIEDDFLKTLQELETLSFVETNVPCLNIDEKINSASDGAGDSLLDDEGCKCTKCSRRRNTGRYSVSFKDKTHNLDDQKFLNESEVPSSDRNSSEIDRKILYYKARYFRIGKVIRNSTNNRNTYKSNKKYINNFEQNVSRLKTTDSLILKKRSRYHSCRDELHQVCRAT